MADSSYPQAQAIILATASCRADGASFAELYAAEQAKMPSSREIILDGNDEERAKVQEKARAELRQWQISLERSKQLIFATIEYIIREVPDGAKISWTAAAAAVPVEVTAQDAPLGAGVPPPPPLPPPAMARLATPRKDVGQNPAFGEQPVGVPPPPPPPPPPPRSPAPSKAAKSPAPSARGVSPTGSPGEEQAMAMARVVVYSKCEPGFPLFPINKKEAIKKLLEQIEAIQRDEYKIIQASYQLYGVRMQAAELKAFKAQERFLLDVKIEYLQKIFELSNGVLYCNMALRLVILEKLKAQLSPEVVSRYWQTIVQYVENLTRPRTLLEQHQMLLHRVEILQAEYDASPGNTALWSQLMETKSKITKQATLLRRLVKITPVGAINLAEMSLEQIIKLHKEQHAPGFKGPRTIDAQRLIAVLNSSNPAQELTVEDLDLLINPREIEKFKMKKIMEVFTSSFTIESPVAFVKYEERAIRKFVQQLSNVSSQEQQSIIQGLMNFSREQFEHKALFAPLLIIDLKADDEAVKELLLDHVVLLTNLIEQTKEKFQKNNALISQLKIESLRDPAKKANNAKIIAELERQQEVLQTNITMFERQYNVIVTKAKQFGQLQAMFAKKLQSVIEAYKIRQRIVAASAENKATKKQPVICGEASEASRNEFMYMLPPLSAQDRRQRIDGFFSGKYFTCGEYFKLLANAMGRRNCLTLSEQQQKRYLEIVTEIQQQLQLELKERYKVARQNPAEYPLETDVILQETILAVFFELLKSKNKLTVAEFEELFLEIPRGEFIVLDAEQKAQYRSLPIEDSWFFLKEASKTSNRNQYFSKAIMSLHQPPSQLISKFFTSAQMAAIVKELNMKSFDPLNVEDNELVIKLMASKVAKQSESFPNSPDLAAAYLVVAIENILTMDSEGKQHPEHSKLIVTDTEPYCLTLSPIRNSAYDRALKAQEKRQQQLQAAAAASAQEEAPSPTAAEPQAAEKAGQDLWTQVLPSGVPRGLTFQAPQAAAAAQEAPSPTVALSTQQAGISAVDQAETARLTQQLQVQIEACQNLLRNYTQQVAERQHGMLGWLLGAKENSGSKNFDGQLKIILAKLQRFMGDENIPPQNIIELQEDLQTQISLACENTRTQFWGESSLRQQLMALYKELYGEEVKLTPK